MESPRILGLVGIALSILVSFGTSADAGTIQLRWDPVAGAAGYRVYYGTSSGSYSRSVTVGNVTTTALTGLEDCTEYFMAIKAYNGAGESPEFSNEVSGWARPTVTAVDPAVRRQGSRFTMEVRGANFESGATLAWDASGLPVDHLGNPLFRLESSAVISCSRMHVAVAIEPGARGFRAMPLGEHVLNLRVVNPDGVPGAGAVTFEIVFEPRRADINRSDASTIDRVDGQDLAWLAYAYGTLDGAPRFNPDADLDGNGLVDGDDLALLSPRFGRCWSGSSWTAEACR